MLYAFARGLGTREARRQLIARLTAGYWEG